MLFAKSSKERNAHSSDFLRFAPNDATVAKEKKVKREPGGRRERVALRLALISVDGRASLEAISLLSAWLRLCISYLLASRELPYSSCRAYAVGHVVAADEARLRFYGPIFVSTLFATMIGTFCYTYHAYIKMKRICEII